MRDFSKSIMIGNAYKNLKENMKKTEIKLWKLWKLAEILCLIGLNEHLQMIKMS